jgi:DNA repair exonuclease SbcCD ATPase subunit
MRNMTIARLAIKSSKQRQKQSNLRRRNRLLLKLNPQSRNWKYSKYRLRKRLLALPQYNQRSPIGNNTGGIANRHYPLTRVMRRECVTNYPILQGTEETEDSPVSKIQQLETELGAFESKSESLSKDSEVLKIATEMLRDGGIKKKIIRQYIPIINKLVNKYLSALDFFVNFELDEEFNEVIKSRYRDEFSYASFSEGEKMRIDLALLFTWRAVAKLKNSTNTNLLILDEVFDASLDTTGCDEFLKLLSDIGGDTNVFVISHKGDVLTDKFRSQIRFEKVKNFSRIAGV